MTTDVNNMNIYVDVCGRFPMCFRTAKRIIGIIQQVFSNEGFMNRSAKDLPQS